jgi:glycosyltransferase involved in cell wall biosynthesis
MISVVLPAHNEASVIRRSLERLMEGFALGEIDAVVVCNGCTDNTAEIARSIAGVRVIETDVASKTNALNLGDRAVRGYPRFYVDADVIMPGESLRMVAQILRSGKYLAAAPRMESDMSDSNWFVRAFQQVWMELPYCREGMIAGAYGISQEGRKRFGQFPAVTADDAFVRLHFSPAERCVVDRCTFIVKAPRTLSAMIKIKTRGYFGNHQLRKRFPELFRANEIRHTRPLLGLIRRPSLWPSLAVYVYVRTVSRLLGYRRYYLGNHAQWERDETSRQVMAST